MFNRTEAVWGRGSRRCVPAGRGVLVGRNDDHLHGDRGAQEVDHLLVRERRHGNLADLHQPAALPQAGLPGVTVRLHLGHDALVVDVEAQLAEPVPAQGHLRRLAAFGQKLEKGQNVPTDHVYSSDAEQMQESDLWK